MSRTIHINGRFLAAPPTGVQRVARELVAALAHDLAERPGPCTWRLWMPPGRPVAEPELQSWEGALQPRILSGPIPAGGGQGWEQATLAAATRGGVLLNLANTAPLLHPRNIVMLHDAQVHDAPSSYSAAFRAWYRFMQPRVARKAARVLTVSRHSAGRLVHHRVAAADRIEVIHNGVDHALRVQPDPSILARSGLAPGRYLLGFASPQPHKNAGLLLDLFSRPRADGLVLALVGSALPAGAVPPGPHVKLLGRVDDAGLRALYENAFAFLSPSTTEGFGLPPGEAMRLGCPAIVAGAGAQLEVWGEAALLAPPDDVAAWRAHIDRMSAEPAWCAAQAQRGREIASRLTWAKAAARLRVLAEDAAC